MSKQLPPAYLSGPHYENLQGRRFGTFAVRMRCTNFQFRANACLPLGCRQLHQDPRVRVIEAHSDQPGGRNDDGGRER